MLIYITSEDISNEAVILIVLLKFTENARKIKKLAGCKVKKNPIRLKENCIFTWYPHFFLKSVSSVFKNMSEN